MPMTGERILYFLKWIKVFSGWQHDGKVLVSLLIIVFVHLGEICGRNIDFSACCDRKSEDYRGHLFSRMEDGLKCLKAGSKLSNFINLHLQTFGMCRERQ
jgi:hypothetical protein